ncbi:NAD(P)-dependent oxidoreductase [bacterium]|nr:NAD(P)-dependent oxidoreductase [bacterium]
MAAQRILITGTGQLGSALELEARQQGHEVRAMSHAQLDVCDALAVLELARAWQPELILHTAAITRVGWCESHSAQTTEVNSNGTVNVLQAAEAVDAALVFFSTDYVFSGRRPGLRLESEATAPINVYGASKAIIEPLVLEYGRGHVVRISGVFGPRRDGQTERCFFRAIYEGMQAGRSLAVVQDQWTAVSYAPHLAQMLFSLQGSEEGLPRLVHLSSAGANSWYGWARELAEVAGFNQNLIQAVSSEDYGDPTPRPRHSVLGSEIERVSRLVANFPARQGLEEYCRYLRSGAAQ